MLVGHIYVAWTENQKHCEFFPLLNSSKLFSVSVPFCLPIFLFSASKINAVFVLPAAHVSVKGSAAASPCLFTELPDLHYPDHFPLALS